MASPELIRRVESRRRLRRGIYVLPSIFTVGTLVCGCFALLSTLKGTRMIAAEVSAGLSLMAFDSAAKAIGLAILFDSLDGLIARLTSSTSDFGREFDSLADVITFGVAPAFLAFAWGVQPVDEAFGTQLVQHLRTVGWIITFAFVICGAARLARFNISTPKPASDRRYFVGLPIPGAAGVIASVVHFVKSPLSDWRYAVAWLAVVAALSFLMVSRIRYRSFKVFDLRQRRSFVAIILIGLIIWSIWAYSEWVLLLLALTYAVAGPAARIVSRLSARSAATKPEGAPRREVPVA